MDISRRFRSRAERPAFVPGNRDFVPARNHAPSSRAVVCPRVRDKGTLGTPMEFFYHELDKDVLILSADGGLNADTAGSFVQQLESLIDAGVKQIIVDCSRLNYISSYGIGVLVRLHNKLAKLGGDVKIAAPQSFVLKALNLVHLSNLLAIYPDVDQARLAFRAREAK